MSTQSDRDYGETVSPVGNTSSIRLLFELEFKKKIKITKCYIKTAFLYGHLSDETFTQIPKGFENNTEKLSL